MADEDDLLNPDEIEALLNSGGGSKAGGGSPAPKPAVPDSFSQDQLDKLFGSFASKTPLGSVGDLLSTSEIDELMKQREMPPAAAAAPPEKTKPAPAAPAPGGLPKFSNPADLLSSAQSGLEAALANDGGSPSGGSRKITNNPGPGVKPFEYQPLDSAEESADTAEIRALKEVELDLHIELGRTELLIEDVLRLREGSVVPLDKLAGDPVDILVNGRLIARGEVLVLNDNFCVRVAEILAPSHN